MGEEHVQEMLAQYIAMKYPTAMFHSDFGSGANLRWGQAIKQKRQNAGRRGFPDLQICEPIDGWHGFFLEIKKEGIRIIKRNGQLVADNHVWEQATMIEMLRDRGYWADFGIGFDDCREKVDAYMKGHANAERWTRWDS